MDLKGAMEMLRDLSVAAKEPKIIKCPDEPEHVYFLWHGGSIQRVEATPGPRDHSVLDLESLVGVLNNDSNIDREIWFSRKKVIGIFNNTDRRESVTLHLEPSVPMDRLSQLASKRQDFEQRDMISLLRVEFAGCLYREPMLISRIRDVKWRTTESGDSGASQGKASVGKRIEAEVSNLTDLADEIVMEVPVFVGYPWAGNVRCAFDVDPATRKFCIRPMAGEIEAAFRSAESQLAYSIAQNLERAEMKVPVYYGIP